MSTEFQPNPDPVTKRGDRSVVSGMGLGWAERIGASPLVVRN